MKVLLVSFFNDEAYGVRAIHSSLVDKGIDAAMLFFKLNGYHEKSYDDRIKDDFTANLDNASRHEIDLLVSHIKDNRYDVVGFSLVSHHFSLYRRIYKELKDIDHLTIVVGGWEASLNPDKCIHYADFLCIGEGEEPLCELIEKLESRMPTEKIRNFWVRKNGTVIRNPVRPLPGDLSSFPVPLLEHRYSHVIENNRIDNYEPYFDNSRYGTFVGRGCPYRCTYCSNSYMARSVYPGQWSKVRYRSIEHVQEELLAVKERLGQVKSINFYDEVFTPGIEWTRDFFSWYRSVIGIPFYVFFFPGTCSDEKARLLADSGLKGIWIGVQSGSQRVRNEVFKRRYSNEQLINQARIFHKYGVSIRYDFILDNPFETFEESLESIFMMMELPRPFSLNLFSLKYFPNTEITGMARAAGFITEADIDDNGNSDRDTYVIHRDRGSLDNRFINHLAFYISCLSTTSALSDKKAQIHRLIQGYRRSNDITPVEDAVRPFLR